MNQRILQFIEDLNEHSKAYQSMSMLCRAKELQEATASSVQSHLAQARMLKREMIDEQDEGAANALLCCEEILKMHLNELLLYVSLKNDDADAAWDYLVQAQSAARAAMQAHTIAAELVVWVERLSAIEQLLFPKQVFFSVGIRIKRSTCSICGEVYGECDHVVGRPYMGELCGRIIEDGKLEEVSLVDNPANKHARVLQYTDEEGVTRDVLSKRIAVRK